MMEETTQETQERKMEELAFLLNKLDYAYFRNDEQIVSWEEELQELEDEYGKVNLDYIYFKPIFEKKTYRLYDLDMLENAVLIVFDECTLRGNINRIIYLGKNDYKMVLRLSQDYNNACLEDDYASMENICDYIEREFLDI